MRVYSYVILMILFEIIQSIQILVFVAGISGVFYWGSKWFKSLQGAIDAQRTTIEAQKVLTESMATLLSIADAPKMAERYTAYKKIWDEEKEAIETLRRELDAWKAKELENEILKVLPENGRAVLLFYIADRLKNNNHNAIWPALNHLEEQGLVFKTINPHPNLPTWRLSSK